MAWVASAHLHQSKRRQLQAVAERWQHRQLAACFALWCEEAQDKAATLQRLTQVCFVGPPCFRIEGCAYKPYKCVAEGTSHQPPAVSRTIAAFGAGTRSDVIAGCGALA